MERRIGQQIYQGWGLTETSPFATYNHDTSYRRGSVGTPIEDVQIKICNEDGREVSSGEPGEIAVRGPNVFQGYFNDPQATCRVIRDGWFFTGDIGRLDDDGYLYILRSQERPH